MNGKNKVNKKGVSRRDENSIVAMVDPRYNFRAEVGTLPGSPAKAKTRLGGQPRAIFPELAAEMVRGDLKQAERDRLNQGDGYSTPYFHESHKPFRP